MKQTSYSLLTLNLFPFTASWVISASPRVKTETNHRRLTPFCFYWKRSKPSGSMLPGFSCSPRSIVHSWLGEGRIRSLLHKIYRSLPVICVLASSIPIVYGAGNVAIRLKEEASIRSEAILLKDVAELNGTDRNAIEKLSKVVLGPSPEFGTAKILSRYQINERIQAGMHSLGDVPLSGAAAVQVRIEGIPVDPDEIAAMLKSYVSKNTSWKESEIEIQSIGGLKGVELPPDGGELRMSQTSAVISRGSITAPIEILQADKTLRCFWIAAGIVIHSDAWVAAQKIVPGQIVKSNDFVKQSTRIEDLRTTYVHTLDEVVGKVARRRFSPGDLIVREAFVDPFLVKKGETVQLRLERSGVMLTAQARAEQDGRLGQMIRVRNLDFATVLKAQVTGRLQVMLP
jgi:flagella basal body P-ring formation protein FlgA